MTRRRTRVPDPPDPAVPCGACSGSQTVAAPVRVGRSRRLVGAQDGFCLRCFGTGEEPTSTTPDPTDTAKEVTP